MSETRKHPVLNVEGRVDALTAPDLDRQLEALGEEGPATIIVDLGGTTYISSSGLRVLLLAHRREAQRGGQLVLRNPPPKIQRVMCMCGFDRVFNIVCESEPPSASEEP